MWKFALKNRGKTKRKNGITNNRMQVQRWHQDWLKNNKALEHVTNANKKLLWKLD